MKLARTAADNAVLIALAGVVGILGLSVIVDSPETSTPGPWACWVEDKADGTAERICGDVQTAPQGSHSFADTVPNEDEPAFDCRADGNQTCGKKEVVQNA